MSQKKKQKQERRFDGSVFNRSLQLGWRDPNQQSVMQNTNLHKEYRDSLMESSGIMSRIVTLLPFFATKEGLDIKTGNLSLDEKIERWIADDQILNILKESWIQARVHGGSAIWLFKAGDNEQPGRSDFTSLIQLDKDELSQGGVDIIRDPSRKDFGYPAVWEVNPTQSATRFPISTDRIIRFEGIPVRRSRASVYNYFGKSYLESIYHKVLLWSQSVEHASQLLSSVTLDILKTDLMSQLQDNGTNNLESRLAYLGITKNNRSVVAIDKEGEDYSQISKTFSGIDSLFERFDDALVIETGYPKLILLGRSPSGMNANSSNEMQHFLDLVRVEQKNYLEPKIRKLVESKFGISEFAVEWRNLDKPG